MPVTKRRPYQKKNRRLGGPMAPMSSVPPPMQWPDFIGITRPFITWFRFMTEDQKRALPPQVLNAMDSLDQLHGRTRT